VRLELIDGLDPNVVRNVHFYQCYLCFVKLSVCVLIRIVDI